MSGEDDLIARHFAPIAGPAGLGLLDDAGCLSVPPGRELVLTTDALVAGVHFLPGDPPDTIAAKALGVNLSDLAAKGAEPEGFLLSLALPDGWTDSWLAAFSHGLAETASAHGCPLLGGDTVHTPGPLTLSVTALGSVPTGRMVRRTTARPGDLVCVTGTIGDAALGLMLLMEPGKIQLTPSGGEQLRGAAIVGAGTHPGRATQGADDALPPGRTAWMAALSAEACAFLVERYRRPRPRLALAAALRQHASAAMDVSDGLAGDLAKLLRAGGVTGTLDLDHIPLSSAARAALAREPALLDCIAGGGDDYEILFTIPASRRDAMARDAAALGLAVKTIGEVRNGTEPLAVRLEGAPYGLAVASFQHSWSPA